MTNSTIRFGPSPSQLVRGPLLCILLLSGAISAHAVDIEELLAQMTLEEKIGQTVQINSPGEMTDELRGLIRKGQIGSMLNEIDVANVNELQRIAVEESRLGIPLLVARDVIHGFRTITPIPLGQAATFNPALVRQGARISALEAASTGINWTFAPMIDITRDPRWGRIAESFGEDAYLTSVLGVAMVEGYQGDDLSAPGAIAACAKHFAGYGASEAGRDYNTTNIAEHELRNVYLRPFHATVDAGVATLMTSFSDLNGIPASGNRFLLQDILRDEWGFHGMVVSDWASISQLSDHGLTADDRDAARAALLAGVNMEMVSTSYRDHLAELIASASVDQQRLDEMVLGILRTKERLGLFESATTDPAAFPPLANPEHLAVAKEMATQSLVLLENRHATLPLSVADLDSIAVIGPLANAPHEQMGTWVFDGDAKLSQTPLDALRLELADTVEINYAPGLANSRDRSTDGFEDAIRAAKASDVVLVFLGEESILSGEAHSRANIDLPGSQVQLVSKLTESGKPVVAVILAGRPLTLANVASSVDALIFAWHPGTMAGPAIADVLLGKASPSGKLPVTFPRMVGQVPIYYGHKNTGKPATADNFTHMDDFPERAHQAAYGMTSHHIDAGFTPLYPFGYGLSYTTFDYRDLQVRAPSAPEDEPVTISAVVTNTGTRAAVEVVQLYVRDLVGSVTRPVRELKDFSRVHLQPGASQTVTFELTLDDLTFYGPDMTAIVEPGEFHVWVGGSSTAELQGRFRLQPQPE